MSQENHQACGSGGGGARSSSSRRFKQNKVPQRGLGVEKLERIRLEEQKKNDGTGVGLGASPVVLPLPSPHRYQSTPSVPFPSDSPSDLSSLPSPTLVANSKTTHLPSYPTQNIYASSSTGRPPAFGWPVGCIDSVDLHSDNMNLETDFSTGSTLNLDKPNWPPLLVMQWRQHNQHQFSSLMNLPLSTSSSSGLNFQIEPPSNQNNYSNYNQGNYLHSLCHEDKMLGMKRSRFFSVDNLPDSSFPCNATSIVPPFRRSDETYGKGNPILREGYIPELNPNKRIKENGTLDGDFLSLGLLASTPSSSITPKLNQPFAFPPPDYHELSKIEVHPFQGSLEDQVMHSKGYFQQQYSFFPSKEQLVDQSTSMTSKGEVGDRVDLTLKL